MRISQISPLRGPNRYGLMPHLEAVLDTGLPEPLAAQRAQAVADQAMRYQQQAGSAVSQRTVLPTETAGVYRLAIACHNTALARAALELACTTVAQGSTDTNMQADLAQLRCIEPDPLDLEVRNGYPDKQIIAVTGTNGKTTTVRLIAHIMQATGKVVGWTSTEGSWLGHQLLEHGDNSGPISARSVLRHPEVQVAVLETARGGILREGLAFPHTDVAVVTNVSADHLGLRGVNTLAELARVKQVIVDALRPGGTAVLNAENEYTSQMAQHLATGVRLLLFALDPHTPILAAHLASGGIGCYRDGNQLVLAQGNQAQLIATLDHVPLTLDGKLAFHVQNVLAAAGASWAAGVSLEVIAQALATFQGNSTMNQGRFNRYNLNGATVIVDYGHNPAALAAVGQAVAAMSGNRRIAILTTAGDRRDEDMRLLGAAAAPYFDLIMTTDGRHRRGRREGEIARIIAEGAAQAKPGLATRPYADADAAAREALTSLQPGDLLLIAEDDATHAVREIEAHGGVIDETAHPQPQRHTNQ